MRALLDPKVDFVFKKIFGSEKHPKILISFLNAVIKPIYKITGVELKETDINKDSLEDKFSRLDVKAVTSSGEHINIEMSSEEVREAKTELIRLSNDDKERELYNLREKANKDRASALEKARNDGVEEGIEKGIERERIASEKKLKKERLETAKNLLSMGLDKNKVSEATKLTIQEIDKI